MKEMQDRNFYYIFKCIGPSRSGSSSIHFFKTKDSKQFVNLICDNFEDQFKNIENEIGSDENIVIYGQKLRFCLETKIKEHYFGYSQDSLSNMVEQVVKTGSNKFNNFIANKDIILSINKYCNTGGLAHYPRDGSTCWTELKNKIQDYLNLEL